MVHYPERRYLVAAQGIRSLSLLLKTAGFSETAQLRKEGQLPRNDPFTKWELVVIRSAALVLVVIAAIQLIAPEISRLVRQIIEWFPARH